MLFRCGFGFEVLYFTISGLTSMTDCPFNSLIRITWFVKLSVLCFDSAQHDIVKN